MNLVCGKATSVSVVASVRRALFELQNAAGSISVSDRMEFLAAVNSLEIMLESHLGGAA